MTPSSLWSLLLSFIIAGTVFAQITVMEYQSVEYPEELGLHLMQTRVTQGSNSHFQQPMPIVPYWPVKGGNMNHSGFSPFTGTHNLTSPIWRFSEPNKSAKGPDVPSMKVFHGSPVIDESSNVYIQSTTGWVYSLTPSGALRWSVELSAGNPGNLALADGFAFTCSQDGVAWAIDTATGNVAWSRKIAHKCADDTHSLTAVDGTILTACKRYPETPVGSDSICALSATDGQTKWNYSLAMTHKGFAFNPVHNVVGDSIIFNDIAQGVYRVSLTDGSEEWYKPGPSEPIEMSTAGLVVGPNNKAYLGANMKPNGATRGVVRSFDISTGQALWNVSFVEGVNAAPAVGPLGPDGRIAVIVTVGDNLACLPIPFFTGVKHAQVKALDAETGAELWTFSAPEYSMSIAGNFLPFDVCCPDVWGQPALGADGTVYVNWSGGISFALRDANGDGTVDPNDAAEVSVYHHGNGSNGNTALAPHLTVAVTCEELLAYSS